MGGDFAIFCNVNLHIIYTDRDFSASVEMTVFLSIVCLACLRAKYTYQTWNFFLSSETSVFLPSMQTKIIITVDTHVAVIARAGCAMTLQAYSIIGR